MRTVIETTGGPLIVYASIYPATPSRNVITINSGPLAADAELDEAEVEKEREK